MKLKIKFASTPVETRRKTDGTHYYWPSLPPFAGQWSWATIDGVGYGRAATFTEALEQAWKKQKQNEK